MKQRAQVAQVAAEVAAKREKREKAKKGATRHTTKEVSGPGSQDGPAAKYQPSP